MKINRGEAKTVKVNRKAKIVKIGRGESKTVQVNRKAKVDNGGSKAVTEKAGTKKKAGIKKKQGQKKAGGLRTPAVTEYPIRNICVGSLVPAKLAPTSSNCHNQTPPICQSQRT